MALDRFNDGPDSARDKLNRGVDDVAALKKLRGDNVFIEVRGGTGAGGYTVALNIDAVAARLPKAIRSPWRGFHAQVTYSAGGGEYTLVQQDPQADGTFVNTTDGLTVTAFEENLSPFVPVNTYVWVLPGTDEAGTATYRFIIAGADGTKRCRVKTIAAETLSCVLWDGTTEGSSITVAKPWHLRQNATITARDSVSSYPDTISRIIGTETQTYLPSYTVNDEIQAELNPVGGTGVAGVDWLSHDTRQWATACASTNTIADGSEVV